MVSIKYIEHSGTEYELDVAPGLSFMEAARNNNVPGILADCGGACACATCHVFVDEKWLDKLPEMSGEEDDMLEFGRDDRDSRSRLSCQIKITEDMDGIVLYLPEKQV